MPRGENDGRGVSVFDPVAKDVNISYSRLDMNAEVNIAARIPKPVYAQILKRQNAVERLTGIRPSVSAVVRQMLGEAVRNTVRRRKS